jgi:hypothetical protein
MRRLLKLRSWLWIALVFGLGVEAVVADTPRSPYLGIAGSNVFRLKQPDRKVFEPPVLPLPRIKLVGITTIGQKRALLKVFLPARPPEPATEFSYILAVGQRSGAIQLLEVDELAGSVKVSNSGKEMLLTLETDRAGPQNPVLPPEPPPLPIRSASRQ